MEKFAENGFSLVEVLVSILVLAIGVIGAAGAQLAAQRAVQQTAFQNFAVQLAAEISDAIRTADRQGSPAMVFLTQVDYKSGVHDEPVLPHKLCYMEDCDAEEFLQFEIYEWKKRIRNALPEGRLQICRDPAPAAYGTGEALAWGCGDANDNAAPVVIKLGWRSRNQDGSADMSAGEEPLPLVALTVSPAAE